MANGENIEDTSEKNRVEPEKNLKVIQAIESGDAEVLYDTLQNINEVLTGERTAPASEDFVRQDISEFLDVVKRRGGGSMKLYLADGGYSRLIVEVMPDRIGAFVAERNSSQIVKDKWEKIKDQVNASIGED